MIKLPKPKVDGGMPIERALLRRRSLREYQNRELTLQEMGQILWAAQGITDPMGYRTVPSAGALYPIELCLVAGKVGDLLSGIYSYQPHQHQLKLMAEGDRRKALGQAAFQQTWIAEAPAVVVITGVYERTMMKYGQRGIQYVHIEVGHVAQNIYLQAMSLGLGTVDVGAFWEEQVKQALEIPDEEEPLCIMPLGRP